MGSRGAGLDPVPAADLSWCHDVVRDVSRTFAISIDVLDEPTSSYVCVGYLVCRIADTIEDTARLAPSVKVSLLDRYDRVFDPADEFDVDAFEAAVEPSLLAERGADWTVVADAGRVLRTVERLPTDVRAAIVPPTRELVEGMATFVDRHADHGGIRIRSASELEAYCYYVAGTVGHLLTIDRVDRRLERAVGVPGPDQDPVVVGNGRINVPGRAPAAVRRLPRSIATTPGVAGGLPTSRG